MSYFFPLKGLIKGPPAGEAVPAGGDHGDCSSAGCSDLGSPASSNNESAAGDFVPEDESDLDSDEDDGSEEVVYPDGVRRDVGFFRSKLHDPYRTGSF
jgi:hypothetical protein